MTTSNRKIVQMKDLTRLKDIEDFSNNLQKGDLALSLLIQYGFVLYGQTKTGKTATSHILSGNPLKGTKLGGEFHVIPTTFRNKKAKIGNEGTSQTMIPNFFQVKLKNKIYSPQTKLYIIDTPGYGDSYGVLRILANGYYHYRLYSKVKNMKFIICFDMSQIGNTASGLISTIKQFTSSFKNYLKVKQKIWACSAFLITKTETQNITDLYKKLQDLSQNLKAQLGQDQDNALKDFIKYIIKNERLFCIKKVNQGESTQCNEYLQRMDEKISSWYSRKVDTEKQIVDMTQISFSLANQVLLSILDKKESKVQFIELINYYNIRIRQFVELYKSTEPNKKKGSLAYVINQLVKDTMGTPQSHQFLKVMKNFINDYYYQYDGQYQQERQKRQRQLFSSNETGGDQSLKFKMVKDKNYIVKKFKALQKIQKLKIQINKEEIQERSLNWLEKCQKNVYEIIKQFNKISYKKNNSVEIIYKYGYIVHRIIEETKVFVLLIQIQSADDIKNQILNITKDFIDLFALLKDFMGVQYGYDSNYNLTAAQLQIKYALAFDQKNKAFEKLIINEPLIDFFSNISSKCVEDYSIMKKVIKLVLKFSDQIMLVINEEENKFHIRSLCQRLIHRLTVSRINCQNLYYEQKSEENLILIRKLTTSLGNLLQVCGKYEIARKVYDSIKFVTSVCRVFKVQIQAKPKDIDLRIQYSRYLSQHMREHEGIYALQEAFELADKQNDINNIRSQLFSVKLRLKSEQEIKYAQDLYEKIYFNEFGDDLEKQIDPQ